MTDKEIADLLKKWLYFSKNIKDHFQTFCGCPQCTMSKNAKVAACFYCEEMFMANTVKEFITERRGGEDTALCPLCGIDSVICDKDVVITPEPISTMRKEWFDTKKKMI